MRHLATVPNVTILALLAALPLIGVGSAQAATGVPSMSPAQGASSQDRDQPVVRRVLQVDAESVFGPVTSDGRFIPFTDYSTAQIGVLELATGESRYLTDPLAAGYVGFQALISPDGELVTFPTFDAGEGVFVLSLAGVDGSPPRVLYRTDRGAGYVFPAAWSPDGTTILAQVVREDGTNALGFISVDDGSLRVLKSLDWRRPSLLSSPDGRWVAFDVQTDQDSPNRDIFILASDGSRQTTLIEHPAQDGLLGWTPDGSTILFQSDRFGTPSWFAVRVADGKAQGDPVLVRPDMWGTGGRGFTEDGTFYYGVTSGWDEVYTATMDPETGALITPPVAVSGRYGVAARNFPQWSPDGKYLAFVANRRRGGSGGALFDLSIVIRSMATGESREIIPDLEFFAAPVWSHDGQSFLISGTKNGRSGIYRVDGLTGAVTTIARGYRPNSLHQAADGKTIYYLYSRQNTELGGVGVFKHDLESGEVTRLYGAPGGATSDARTLTREFGFRGMALSPNDSQLALISGFGDAVLVMDTSGGSPRELIRVTGNENELGSFGGPFGQVMWSPDGLDILFRKQTTPEGLQELWRVPAEGGEAVRLGSGLAAIGDWATHPDGRQIVYKEGEVEREIWVMENFLPIDGLRTSSGRR